MGTNFYLRGFRNNDSPEHHIGKRSAAGMYCWDCRITLCKYGEDAIHHSRAGEKSFYENCPKCGKAPKNESNWKNTSGRELGVNDEPPQKKTGVASCSSFTWAMEPNELFEVRGLDHECPICSHPLKDGKVIEDEYGHLFTVQEFKQILEECPVQYRNLIGEVFS